MTVPDLPKLEQIGIDLNQIGLQNPEECLEHLRRFQREPEVMEIPSIKRLFQVLDTEGMKIRQPLMMMLDQLLYVVFQGLEKYVIFGDQSCGPYQFLKIVSHDYVEISVWRRQKMLFLIPNERGDTLCEIDPDALR